MMMIITRSDQPVFEAKSTDVLILLFGGGAHLELSQTDVNEFLHFSEPEV